MGSEETAARSVDQVADALREDIVFGRLRPRERLIEDELSERFGTSRHVVRAAMATLEQLGLVVKRPNRGCIVKDFTVAEVTELYDLRGVLQLEVARRFPLPPPPGLEDELRELQQRYAQAVADFDFRRIEACDDAFHKVFFRHCGNRYIVEMAELLWQRSATIRTFAYGNREVLAQSVVEHDQICDAIGKCDRERFVDVSVKHLFPALVAFKEAHAGRWSE
ncbi:GntR family transcriptional regulator [Rhodobacter sp. SGA-6-6]|uniref:GntR family transcriptional regulator n=1 Tax=Rhodobacter sp. SGA-6-6 TaxID=2710882 RepID=UPI003211E96D